MVYGDWLYWSMGTGYNVLWGLVKLVYKDLLYSLWGLVIMVYGDWLNWSKGL